MKIHTYEIALFLLLVVTPFLLSHRQKTNGPALGEISKEEYGRIIDTFSDDAMEAGPPYIYGLEIFEKLTSGIADRIRPDWRIHSTLTILRDERPYPSSVPIGLDAEGTLLIAAMATDGKQMLSAWGRSTRFPTYGRFSFVSGIRRLRDNITLIQGNVPDINRISEANAKLFMQRKIAIKAIDNAVTIDIRALTPRRPN